MYKRQAVFDPSGLSGDSPITLTYTFVDENGCENASTTTIEVEELPVATAMTSCGIGMGTGTITVSPTTGYEYSIDNGLSYVAGNEFTNLANGDYDVRIRSTTAQMCESVAVSVNINCMDASCVSTSTICEGGTVTASGDASGADTDLYLLTDASGVVIATNSTGVFTEGDGTSGTIDLAAGSSEYRIYVLNYDSNNAPNPIPGDGDNVSTICLLYTSPSPRD